MNNHPTTDSVFGITKKGFLKFTIWAYAILGTAFGLYKYGPMVIYSFDKVKTEAEVYQLVDAHTVKLRYYHEKDKREYSVSFDFKDMKNAKKAREKGNIKVYYSTHFPFVMTAPNFEPNKLLLPALFMILFYSNALIFFNYYKQFYQ